MQTIRKASYFFLAAFFFFGLTFIINQKVLFFVLVAFVLSKIFSEKKYQIIAAFNVIGWFFSTSLFDKNLIASILNITAEYSWILLKAITLFLVYGGFYFLHKKTNKTQKEFFPIWIVFFSVFSISIVNFFPTIRANLIWNFWLNLLSVVISCSIYFFVLMREKNVSLMKVLYIHPFWGSYLPVPGSYDDLKKIESQKSSNEILGLLSIYFWLIVTVILDLIKVIFLKTYYSGTIFLFINVQNLEANKFFFNIINYVGIIEKYDLYQYVIRPILYFTVFIFEVASLIGIQVGILKIFGFNPMNSIMDFWRSKNFLEFFKKINTYYSHFLFLCFVMPTFSMFGFIKKFKFRVGASIVISVFLWSTFYQFVVIQGVRWTQIDAEKFNLEGFYRILTYNLIISVLLGVSAILIETDFKINTHKKNVFYIKGWIYYSIYAWLGYYFIILGYQSLSQISSSLKMPMPMPINYFRSIIEIKNYW